jgi:hypothetical protein
MWCARSSKLASWTILLFVLQRVYSLVTNMLQNLNRRIYPSDYYKIEVAQTFNTAFILLTKLKQSFYNVSNVGGKHQLDLALLLIYCFFIVFGEKHPLKPQLFRFGYALFGAVYSTDFA